jgi:hypothetical protein
MTDCAIKETVLERIDALIEAAEETEQPAACLQRQDEPADEPEYEEKSPYWWNNY